MSLFRRVLIFGVLLFLPLCLGVGSILASGFCATPALDLGAKGPLELRLSAKQTTYFLSQSKGNKSESEYRKSIVDLQQRFKGKPIPYFEGLGKAPSPLPPVPAVDLELQVRNTSNQPVTIWVGGYTSVVLELKGPEALNVDALNVWTVAPSPLPPKAHAVTLAPGQSYTMPIKQLSSAAQLGMNRLCYWTAAGNYTLTATFQLAAGPEDGSGPKLVSVPFPLEVLPSPAHQHTVPLQPAITAPSIAKASSVKQLKAYDHVTLIRGPLTNTKFVIRDEAAWKLLAGNNQDLVKLKIDFSKQMVLVVAEQMQGRGKSFSHAEVSFALACIPQVTAVMHFQMDPPWMAQLEDLIKPNHFIVVDRADAPVNFSEVVHNPWLNLMVPAVQAPIVPGKGQPKLSVTVDGADLVVSTTISANNSPHALQTSYLIGSDGQVHLKYVLIQNSDLLVRCLKQVTVTWRLTGMAIVPLGQKLSYHVEPTSLVLSTAELGNLLPQLHGLQKAGIEFKKKIPQSNFVQ